MPNRLIGIHFLALGKIHFEIALCKKPNQIKQNPNFKAQLPNTDQSQSPA
jgi:hypothetical protein